MRSITMSLGIVLFFLCHGCADSRALKECQQKINRIDEELKNTTNMLQKLKAQTSGQTKEHQKKVKWEYKCYEWQGRGATLRGTKKANEMGKGGWEMVSGSYTGFASVTVWCFKRQI